MALTSGDEVYLYVSSGAATLTPASVAIDPTTLPAVVKGSYFDISAGTWISEKTFNFQVEALQSTLASLSSGTFNLALTADTLASGDDVYLYAKTGSAAFNPPSVGIQIQTLPTTVCAAYFNVSLGRWTSEVSLEFYNVVSLQSAIDTVSAFQGNLLANEGFNADLTAESGVSGGLGIDINLGASITNVSAVDGDLVKIVQLVATVPADSTVDASVAIELAISATLPSLSSIVGGSPQPLVSDGLIFYNSIELDPSDGGQTFLVTLPVIVNTAIDLSPEE